MRVVSIILALGVALAVFLWIALADAPDADAPGAPLAVEQTRPVDVVAVRSRAAPFQRALRLRGVTEAARKVSVRAQTEGLVISKTKRKGADVAEGDVLCEIEIGDRAADLASAKAKLVQAKADADASGALARRGFSAETKAAADVAALEAAKAALERMELDLKRTKIRAPFAGRLETDAAETGALLSKGDACAVLVDLDPIRLVGYAPEFEAFELKEGAAVEARLVNGAKVSATIAFVARSADPETRTYRVEATAPNPDGRIPDGASVDIAIAKAPDPAHRLPHSALTLNDAGVLGVRLAVENSDGGTVARFAPARILLDDADGVWLGGLPAEAAVILVGQEYVGENAAVAVTYRKPDSQAAATTRANAAAGSDQ